MSTDDPPDDVRTALDHLLLARVLAGGERLRGAVDTDNVGILIGWRLGFAASRGGRS